MAMFVLLSAEFTIFLLVIILRDCNADLPTCRQLSECACALNDGREVNISRLGVPGFPKFNYQKSGNYYYTYNPCYNFKDNYCGTECIACQHNDAGTTSFPLGTAGSAEWSQDGGYYSIHYRDGAGGRSTVVELECDASAQEPRLDVIGESGSSKLYYFRMTTECACPGRCGQTAPQSGGLSAGGVMCIIFSVLVVVYFIGGVLFMKFVRGAGGMELVPNSGFWKELPGYIKDGVMFVISCGKRASYKSMS
ncbi:cation-dependent mannose-6-phosphate receptor-like [Patiria miniata]|uniref:MRH domain-containing protein n=1 Tax=Patiria miniata TaxID=46514 RepID=A0A913Z2G2_PATMI|nr:cation-dependent mannose-6-phosphate receptor-like [Patiria miniata]XP_038057110.1 cation-dependent mannose-6-phosphate receptor-like [Patiria miniata]